ncbi:MAG TPA: hypothetical protein VMA96_14445 [Solirubrobacteraceae bacterium]|nr:hypothetical protein [Solirubrobacteraceae bacterium]
MSGEPEHTQRGVGPALRPVAQDRLADALSDLAAGIEAPDVRAQLNALAALLGNLGRPVASDDVRRPLEESIAAAIGAGDEAGAISAMRQLAALDRSALAPVDWSAATRG